MTALAASQALSWIVIAILSLVVLALARQIGVLHERIAPVGALVTDDGPAIGQIVPAFATRTLDGTQAVVGGPISGPLPALRLLLFVAADCPICKRIVGLARAMTQAESVALTLIGDGPLAPLRAMRSKLAADDTLFVNNAEIGIALHIGKLPYAVLLDAHAAIRAKGLVNSREHLESLLVAHETGHANVQSFLKAREIMHAAE